jgi:hypothetical protein
MLMGVMICLLGTTIACETIKDASEGMCGPCGDVNKGDNFISGDARLDGMFAAVGTFGQATAAIDVSFREDLLALAEVFEVDVSADAALDVIAADVRAAIEAEISANVSGDLIIDYAPPACQAAVDVAVEAQANCEASAGCDVSAECEGGEVAVGCSGQCTGECSGGCQGSCAVEVEGGGCSGECQGSCSLEAGGTCEGICKGECGGVCELQTANGTCEGKCDGECTGTCEMKVAAECSGECHGECKMPQASGSCEGKCEGSCDAQCSGGCEGEVTPPSCSAEGSCEATADCQASAKAQASASLECTPPTLDIRFELDGGLDANAAAKFTAQMAELKVRMAGIVQGLFKLRALVDTEYAAELGIDPPVLAILGQFEVLLTADLDSFTIPPGRLACVLPAFEASIDIFGTAAVDLVVLFEAQYEIVGALGLF